LRRNCLLKLGKKTERHWRRESKEEDVSSIILKKGEDIRN